MTDQYINVCPDTMDKQGTNHFEMVGPVELEDGRRLTIEWNKCDAPKDVAQKFALTHCIASDELPTIEAFLIQTNTMVQSEHESHGSDTQNTSMEEPKSEDAPSMQKQQDSVVEDAAPVEEECSNVADEAPVQEAQNPNVEYYVVSTPEKERNVEGMACTNGSAQQAPKEEDVSPAEEQRDGAPTKKQPDPDIDLKKTAQHLEEMGLGSADVLLELLKSNDGSVQKTLEGLLSGEMA